VSQSEVKAMEEQARSSLCGAKSPSPAKKRDKRARAHEKEVGEEATTSAKPADKQRPPRKARQGRERGREAGEQNLQAADSHGAVSGAEGEGEGEGGKALGKRKRSDEELAPSAEKFRDTSSQPQLDVLYSGDRSGQASSSLPAPASPPTAQMAVGKPLAPAAEQKETREVGAAAPTQQHPAASPAPLPQDKDGYDYDDLVQSPAVAAAAAAAAVAAAGSAGGQGRLRRGNPKKGPAACQTVHRACL
jgi:hypothetical protein